MSGVVIIGAGHAAGQAAASLRQEGFEGDITIVGDEPHPPYQRPPLSKAYLSGEQGVEKVYLRPEKFYADKNVTLHKSARATAINRENKTVAIDAEDGSSQTLGYDHLILATGTRVRTLPLPGADLAGIHYLRSIGDVDAIRDEMQAGKKLIIVGGGYIGLEVAAVAVTAGLDVTVLEMEERILQRVTTPEMSAFYQQVHEGHGVKIVTGARVDSFEGEGSVSTAVCADGSRLDADLVIIGVGVIPNTELASDSGLACENGIMVNERCVTEDPAIYAAGDCTNHPNAYTGTRFRLESVPNAMEQARVCAANICGKDKVYDAVPWFWSDQYDLKLQMVGLSAGADAQVVRGSMTEQKFVTFYMKDGAIISADAINDPKTFMLCKNLVAARAVADPAVLEDTESDLKALLS